MANQNLTTYQRLTKVFGFPGKLEPIETPSFNFSRDELLRTTSKDEYDKSLLQQQQSKYISDKWAKIDKHTYNQSVYNEPNRLASYYDFEGMEMTPEISAALDIFSDESCQLSEKGEILTIFSESPRVKSILNDLFINVLDINTNLPMWTRGMCKYGDDFIYLKINEKEGIIGCQQLPNIEIERVEGGSNSSERRVEDDLNTRELRFRWKNRDIEFQSWEIGHFRLLGDDRKLPYGTSILDKIRRIWKQLILAEDAMLIYRTSRAPERRVFKVFVGNMDDKDIEAYVQRVANKFKRQQIQDPRNGQVDARYNQMSVESDFFVPVRDPNQSSPIETLAGACISLDTEIPLLDGRTLKLNDIIEEWDKGNRDLWVYSADPKTGAVAPGMVTWAGITRKNTDVLKITLDNGEELITTPDHKFVHRTNGFVEAQNLVVGDSLMPFYTQQKKVNPKSSKYEQIWDNEKQKWVFTHRMVANFMKNYNTHNEMLFKEKYINESKLTIHHKNINRYDNSPSNLYFMNNKDHYDSIKGGIVLKNLLNNNSKLISLWKERLSINSKSMWNKLLIDKKNKLYNHKIVSIELHHSKMDTGTITVDGNEQYIDYHTFATKSGVFIKNSNLGEIGDIEYIQKKMLAGLRVPKAFLGFEEVVGDGKSLALMDIRFARAISRVQRSLIQELNKIALIHLYILGLEDELYNFTLGLTNPSSQSELLKIEQWKEKITLYKDATSDQSQLGILPVSHTWAKKNILGMSETEVLLDLEQQRLERAIGFELINTQKIIPRSGVFDNVDRKYGISEEEREEAKTEDGGGEMGGAEMGGGAEMAGGEMAGALSESERKKRHHLINEENVDFTKLFKAKNINDNIYEIDQKINEILNENIT
jgi:hypothetical protein